VNGCYPTPPPPGGQSSSSAPPPFRLLDGLDVEMGFLVSQMQAGVPVPLDLAVKTFVAAIATVYFATLALEVLGVSGRLPLAAAAVLAPVGIQVIRGRNQ